MKHGDPYDCHAWTSRMLAFPTLHQLCFNGDHSAQLEVNAKIVQEILGHVLPSMQRNARIECGWNCRVKHIICEAKCKFNKSSSIILRTHSLPEANTNQYSVRHEGWGQKEM